MTDDTEDFTPIKSSLIDGHKYDPNARVLVVRLKNGLKYAHDDVPIEKYAAFVENPSPGGYWNRKIKSNHPGRQVLK
jgi:KTSC domain